MAVSSGRYRPVFWKLTAENRTLDYESTLLHTPLALRPPVARHSFKPHVLVSSILPRLSQFCHCLAKANISMALGSQSYTQATIDYPRSKRYYAEVLRRVHGRVRLYYQQFGSTPTCYNLVLVVRRWVGSARNGTLIVRETCCTVIVSPEILGRLTGGYQAIFTVDWKLRHGIPAQQESRGMSQSGQLKSLETNCIRETCPLTAKASPATFSGTDVPTVNDRLDDSHVQCWFWYLDSSFRAEPLSQVF
ncbi:hypothetical protein COCSADRAFT_344553 [Bipolaris sorokiniana ND90Pr]|uniref:Uncharacterized protein n=1 Tax=Cochliobolus sativus (strain ND90Pr / ATCC 201652) TaxID=665912 RepID=M2SGX4_COCSN|nr:uncharacterized protein COCSADRAFT_344553 [Bipolaris sorokiniana ND90Pr]EMD61650.1 hypothetical protein COCSADRAFT_344553 [Bipolaris sorokiniana ND90Pr]